jgi:hypothetical protein
LDSAILVGCKKAGEVPAVVLKVLDSAILSRGKAVRAQGIH